MLVKDVTNKYRTVIDISKQMLHTGKSTITQNSIVIKIINNSILKLDKNSIK